MYTRPNLLTFSLTASLLREGTYSTLRMGLYDVLKDVLHAENPRTLHIDLYQRNYSPSPGTTPLWKKILAGATSGALGSGIANPTDLVKVRMQAQGTGPSVHQYPNMWHAFAHIYRTEGLRGLYKGSYRVRYICSAIKPLTVSL